jgi:hypothetical protein
MSLFIWRDLAFDQFLFVEGVVGGLGFGAGCIADDPIRLSQIPPDLVVKSQAVDIAEVI